MISDNLSKQIFATGHCHAPLPRFIATGYCHASLPRFFATPYKTYLSRIAFSRALSTGFSR